MYDTHTIPPTVLINFEEYYHKIMIKFFLKVNMYKFLNLKII